jgi:hypothetical protein
MMCKILGHSARRQKARHDGTDFRAPCRRCGAEMIRLTSGWQIERRRRDLGRGLGERRAEMHGASARR